MVVQLGVDPLHPLRALIDQRLVEPHPLPPLQHLRRRDPRQRQVAVGQQVPEQLRVGPVRLGVAFATTSRLRVGRLGEERLEACRGDLLDHEPPARAALDRDLHRPAVRSGGQLVSQPLAEPIPVRLPPPASPLLARLHLHRIERDLPAVQIQATYHLHSGPPRSRSDFRQTEWLSQLERRRSSHIECSGTPLVGRPAT